MCTSSKLIGAVPLIILLASLFQQVLALANNASASALVRSAVTAWLGKNKGSLPPHLTQVMRNFDKDPSQFKPPAPVAAPPGQPIGDGGDECIQIVGKG